MSVQSCPLSLSLYIPTSFIYSIYILFYISFGRGEGVSFSCCYDDDGYGGNGETEPKDWWVGIDLSAARCSVRCLPGLIKEASPYFLPFFLPSFLSFFLSFFLSVSFDSMVFWSHHGAETTDAPRWCPIRRHKQQQPKSYFWNKKLLKKKNSVWKNYLELCSPCHRDDIKKSFVCIFRCFLFCNLLLWLGTPSPPLSLSLSLYLLLVLFGNDQCRNC